MAGRKGSKAERDTNTFGWSFEGEFGWFRVGTSAGMPQSVHRIRPPPFPSLQSVVPGEEVRFFGVHRGPGVEAHQWGNIPGNSVARPDRGCS